MDATEWVEKATRRLLRANAALAAWAGTDEDSLVRVYVSPAPALEVVAGSSGTGTYRYIDLMVVASVTPERDFSTAEIHEMLVQVNVVDGTGGDAGLVTAGQDLVYDVLQGATLDHASLTAYQTMRCAAAGDSGHPETTDGQAYRSLREYRVKFRKA
jgi:hypothetical protein